jgi:Ca2+/Na+ antiporter
MRSILFVLAAILIIGWLIGFFALKVASGLLHILLVVALIAIIISFFKGKKSA